LVFGLDILEHQKNIGLLLVLKKLLGRKQSGICLNETTNFKISQFLVISYFEWDIVCFHFEAGQQQLIGR